VCRLCHPRPIQTPGHPSDAGGRRAEKALKEILSGERKNWEAIYA
jgi:hypothetical protein